MKKTYTLNLQITVTGTIIENDSLEAKAEDKPQTNIFEGQDTGNFFSPYVAHLRNTGQTKPEALKPQCAFADCEATVFAKGKCKRHYNQMYKAKQKMKGRNI